MALLFSALIFTATGPGGYRHENIEFGVKALIELCEQQSYYCKRSENAIDLTEPNIYDYDLIVLYNCAGEILTEEQFSALQKYVENGGAIVALHGATAAEYNNPAYEALIGARFKKHPAPQTATLINEAPDHPANNGLPIQFELHDEWYAWENGVAEDATILLSVDESTYEGKQDEKEGKQHPIAWVRTQGKGRVFYTALGHFNEVFENNYFVTHFHSGLKWAGQKK